MKQIDVEFLKLARLHPELPSVRPAGIFLRLPAFVTDVSICCWLASFTLAPIAERFRSRFFEIVQIRSLAFAIDAGTAASGDLADAMQGALQETLIDIQEMNVVFALAFVIVAIATFFTYFVLFEGSPLSASPGKLMLGLRVVDRKLHSMTMFRSLVRQSSFVLDALTFGIGPIAMLFGRAKLAFHDRLSHTRVVFFRSKTKTFYRFCFSMSVLGAAIAASAELYGKVVLSYHWLLVAKAAAVRLQEFAVPAE